MGATRARQRDLTAKDYVHGVHAVAINRPRVVAVAHRRVLVWDDHQLTGDFEIAAKRLGPTNVQFVPHRDQIHLLASPVSRGRMHGVIYRITIKPGAVKR